MKIGNSSLQFACSLLLLVVVGCGAGKSAGTVAGSVTFNGAAYTNAAVVFLDLATGQAGSADIQSDGSFQIESPLPPGTYTVYLAPKSVDDTSGPVAVSIDQSVPSKYWNEATSDIKIEVVDGPNEVAVAMTP